MINGFNSRKPILGQKGFTLVEVIVVAIIVAALAAVSIPLYNNYVETSRNNAAANAAGSVASFMGSCMNLAGAVTPDATAGVAGPVTLVCTYGTANSQTSIVVPDGITITITDMDSSPGQVIGQATGSTVTQTYNY